MWALSVRPPWAQLIVNGEKPVENRTYATAYRGPLLIHASKTWDTEGAFFFMVEMGLFVPPREDHAFGALIGRVNLVDCVKDHPSPFFFGPWGYVLESPEQFSRPIPWRGRLGIFEVPDDEFWALV